MISISLLSALLTLSSSASYGVEGYIASKTPLTADDFTTTSPSSSSAETTRIAATATATRTVDEFQVRTVPEISNHDRILQCESSSSILDSYTHSQQGVQHHVAAVASALPLTVPIPVTMSPLEAWCLSHLDRWYSKSQSMKCPFLRRRLGDILDNVETVMKHTLIRKECWPCMGTPQAWRPAGHNKKQNNIKFRHRSLEDIQNIIYDDWKPISKKGYYVTGKLTTAIYRDDCHFLGPDPDMPIRGLRKYVGVAAHLFDFHESESTLKSLEIVDDTIVAEWQLKGILKLPWRPQLPTFGGRTVYHFDKEGLIERHEESWDMTVSHAFCQTLLPELAAKIWKQEPVTSTV